MKKNPNLLIKNERYTSILRIIGRSNHPLTTAEIKNFMIKSDNLTKNQSPYAYELINDLNPEYKEDYSKFLFEWKKILKNKTQQKNIIDILKKHFEIDWIEDFNKNHHLPFENIISFKKQNNNDIIIKNERDPDIDIKITKRDQTSTILKIFQGKEKKVLLYCKDDLVYFSSFDLDLNNPFLEIVGHFYKALPIYLERKFDETINKKIQKYYQTIDQLNLRRKKEMMEKIPTFDYDTQIQKIWSKISKIRGDRRLWRYCLNIRGLILYIIGEMELEEIDKRIHNARINTTIQNLSKNYVN